MNDLQWRRRWRAHHIPVTIGVAAAQLLPLDATRVAVILSASSVGAYSVGTDNTILANQGITMPTTASPLKLTLEEHGALVTQPLFAIAALANTVIGVMVVTDSDYCPCEET